MHVLMRKRAIQLAFCGGLALAWAVPTGCSTSAWPRDPGLDRTPLHVRGVSEVLVLGSMAHTPPDEAEPTWYATRRDADLGVRGVVADPPIHVATLEARLRRTTSGDTVRERSQETANLRSEFRRR